MTKTNWLYNHNRVFHQWSVSVTVQTGSSLFFLSNVRWKRRRKWRRRQRLPWRCQTWWPTVSRAARRRTALVNTCRCTYGTERPEHKQSGYGKGLNGQNILVNINSNKTLQTHTHTTHSVVQLCYKSWWILSFVLEKVLNKKSMINLALPWYLSQFIGQYKLERQPRTTTK